MKRRKPEDRDRIRHRFLAMALCHELKQPLHSLNLNVELLRKRLAAAAEAAEIGGPLQALNRVVDRVNDCLEAFSTRSVPAAVAMELHDVRPLLNDAGERARTNRAGVRVTVACPPLPEIPLDVDQLALALDALLDNAIQASASGGEVILNGRALDEEVHIQVIDHGAGMTPEVARRAFEIGYSTWGGDGTGLTLAKFITYHHGGGFSVNTRPGHGTTISIVLPVTSDGPDATDDGDDLDDDHAD